MIFAYQIHGGGIFTGNARTELYGPDYFMEKDVVLVTFQYRIGVFGFLSLDDPSLKIPGNAQFRDHICALKWVRDNISRFGGDSSNVTLFGESWGGGSTNYHMLSEKSKGLFHRGILMSGTALNPMYSLFPRRNWAKRLCTQLGYTGPEDDKRMLEFLEAADPKEMVLASPKILTEDEQFFEKIVSPFGPTIEPYDYGQAFITDDIIKMMKTGWGNEIDILIGNTSNEMLSMEKMIQVDELFQKLIDFRRYMALELRMAIDDPKREEYAAMLKQNYYGLLEPSQTNVEGLMQVGNDFVLWHQTARVVKSREKSGKGAKTFVYRFDYDSENNFMKKFSKVSEKYREPVHGDDCFYLFKPSMFGPTPALDSEGFKGINLMLNIFTGFAATGNPNVAEIGENVEWQPAKFNEPLKGLNINETTCEFLVLLENDRIKVFDEIFIKENHDLY